MNKMDGECFGKEQIQENAGYGYKEPDYSNPLYTLSLIKKQLTHLNNLVKYLEKQLKSQSNLTLGPARKLDTSNLLYTIFFSKSS